jgi:hypothetical protein
MKQDILDKFLKEISYKFPKGYPDIQDPNDVKLLNKLVMEHINEADQYKPLSFGDLRKKGGARLEKVADLINKEHPFITVKGEKKPLKFNLDAYAQLFSKRNVADIKQLSTQINKFPFFKDKEGNEYTIEDLVKAPELGGKGKGSGTRIEDAEVESLNNQIQNIIQESETQSITIKVGSTLFEGITQAVSVPGNPKADFSLNAGNTRAVFISHKDQTFQQYAGFKGLENQPEIKNFIKSVQDLSQGTLKSKDAYTRPIESDEVKRKAVYGVDQGGDAYGINNCNAVLVGRMTLTKEGDHYLLGAQQEYINPQIPEGDHEPYLTVTYRTDRNSQGVENARFGIYPKKFRPTGTEI